MTFIEKGKVSPFRADVDYTCDKCGNKGSHPFDGFGDGGTETKNPGNISTYDESVEFDCDCGEQIEITVTCSENLTVGLIDDLEVESVGCSGKAEITYKDSDSKVHKLTVDF